MTATATATSPLDIDAPQEAEDHSARPPIVECLADTGVSESFVEQLILKTFYFRNEILGRDLAAELGVKFSVIEQVVELLKSQHLIVVKRSLALGAVSSVYTLTDKGREMTREYLKANQYTGRIPVPLEQYIGMVQAQRQDPGWLTLEMLRESYRHMVVSDHILSQIGPAVNSGKSFLIYGQPGNGKTFLAEALFNINPTPIYIPYAIDTQGQVIQMFDPLYHEPIADQAEESISAFSRQATYDLRWMKVRRPFVVSGGELDLALLDLAYNEVSKFYDAPLHLKANNGIYLIDDFGRQKSTPAEILNRWIVPMEKGYDFLSFKNGAKIQIPFSCFLIFSSNLKPEKLGDEAFLRRIQYKMLMRNPDESEYFTIFEKFAAKNALPYEPDLPERFLTKHYRATGKKRRRCHPRDLLTHAMDLIRFERRPWQLTEEVLDHAFEGCFVSTADDE